MTKNIFCFYKMVVLSITTLNNSPVPSADKPLQSYQISEFFSQKMIGRQTLNMEFLTVSRTALE